MISSFFGSVSSFFWVRLRDSKKVLKSQFVDRFLRVRYITVFLKWFRFELKVSHMAFINNPDFYN